MTVRKTAAVRRGLRELVPLAVGDFEQMSRDRSRWSAAEARDVARAIAWLREQSQEPSKGGAS